MFHVEQFINGGVEHGLQCSIAGSKHAGFPRRDVRRAVLEAEQSDQQHKEETDKLSEALNNNTIVMQRLVEKLGGVDNE